ncbi:hypothetical protein DQF30_24110 [Shigella flexneri]|nr:hypothetical protein [Shigella flexneri]
MATNPLTSGANKTIRNLKSLGLLTDDHALTVALIKELCAEWSAAQSTTQRAAISKELRYALALLPTPPEETDDVADLLAELADDDG